MTLLLLPLLGRLVLAGCPADIEHLRSAVDSGLEAYDKWAWTAFEQQVAEVRGELGCLQQVPAPGDIERLHLLSALAAHRAGDQQSMVAAFRGVLAVSPNYAPPETLAALGSELRVAWELARKAGPGAIQPIGLGRVWYVDGRAGATEIPTERAAPVQHVGRSGGLKSWYLQGDGDLRDIFERPSETDQSVASPSSRPAPPKAEPPKHASHPSRTLATLALGTGAAAGLALGLNWYAISRCNNVENTSDEYQTWWSVNRASGYTAGGLGLATGGLLVGAAIVGRW